MQRYMACAPWPSNHVMKTRGLDSSRLGDAEQVLIVQMIVVIRGGMADVSFAGGTKCLEQTSHSCK